MELKYRWRVPLAVSTVMVLTVALVLIVRGPVASGAHIPATGPIPSNCVEFQANDTGTKSPASYPGVDITLDSWGDDVHEITFTITGLVPNQYVDISVKSGTDVLESGAYGNGTHTFNNSDQQQISHVRLCVFGVVATTTSSEVTTTTEGTTTTTQGTTTTTGGTTTTTGGPPPH